jgi:hypothetical protein
MEAKASFAVTCCLWYVSHVSARPRHFPCLLTVSPSILYTTYVAVSIWFAIPSRRQRIKHSSANDVERPSRSSTWSSSRSAEKKHEVEMSSFSPPMSPMTPRTVAFHTLNGKRPSMGPMSPMAQGRASRTNPGGVVVSPGPGPGPGGRRLNKDLPLRHHIAMGNETFKGKAPVH